MFKNKAFTLVEIIISLVIFAITMVGVTNLLVYSKRQTGQAHSRMVQGELERYFLDRLQMHVREDTWDTPANYLTSGDYKSPHNFYFIGSTVDWLDEFDRQLNPNPTDSNDIMYYSVQRVRGVAGTSLRKVRLTIIYPSDTYD